MEALVEQSRPGIDQVVCPCRLSQEVRNLAIKGRRPHYAAARRRQHSEEEALKKVRKQFPMIKRRRWVCALMQASNQSSKQGLHCAVAAGSLQLALPTFHRKTMRSFTPEDHRCTPYPRNAERLVRKEECIGCGSLLFVSLQDDGDRTGKRAKQHSQRVCMTPSFSVAGLRS